MTVTPVLEMLRQADPWPSLARWPDLILKLQASKRPCLKQKVDGFWEQYLRLTAMTSTHVHTQNYKIQKNEYFDAAYTAEDASRTGWKSP